MRKLFIISVFALLTISLHCAAQASQKSKRSDIIENIDGTDFYIHFVKKGETLPALLNTYNVSIEELKQYNQGINDEIKPNTILKILKKDVVKTALLVSDSKPNQSVSPKSEYTLHKVQPKETLYGISKKYQVSINDLREANGGLTEGLKIGQVINVPEAFVVPQSSTPEISTSLKVKELDQTKGTNMVTPPTGETNLYTVKAKETLYSIAKSHGLTVEELINANPEVKSGLKVGAQLVIPESSLKVEKLENKPIQTSIVHKVASTTFEDDTIHLVINHRIKKKETVFSISQKYGISMGEFYSLNPQIKNEGLKIDRWVKVPAVFDLYSNVYVVEKNRQQYDSTVYYIKHKVERRQRLSEIAQIYNVSEYQLRWLNPGVKSKPSRRYPVYVPVKKKLHVIAEPEEEVIEELPEEEEIVEIQYHCENDDPFRTWKVALMIPFSLETLNNQDIDRMLNMRKDRVRSLNFIQFYEGALLALDSLQNAGMNIEVYTFDVDKDPEKALRLFNDTIQQMDLIIGPVYRNTFALISEYAQRYGIPVINPLSKKYEVVENRSNVFKVQSSIWSSLDAISNDILNNAHDSTNVIILRHNEYQDVDRVEYLKSRLEGELMNMDLYIQESVYMEDDFEGFLNNNFPDNENVVINVSDDEVFVIDMMRQMHEIKDSIPYKLYGMPDWTRFKMETGYLLDLNVHLFENTYIDYDRPEVEQFVHKFYNYFGSGPEARKYAFVGYDVTFYFMQALNMYGKDFKNCLDQYYYEGLESKFEFEEQPSGSFENKGVYGYEYRDYQKIRIR